MPNAGKLADRAGITYRQLDYWTRQGLIEPADNNGGGSGNHRWFTEGEARIVCLMARFTSEGVHPNTAVRLARELAAERRARLGGFLISEDGQA